MSRIVGLLGADLGPEDHFLDTRPDNPTGYWENRDITRLNDAILARFDARWDEPPTLAEGWETTAEMDSFRGRARSILEESFGKSRVAAWKDPRMSILLPFWHTVTPIDAVVLAVRHPAEVAGSLAARDGIDPEKAAALWIRYTADAWLNGANPLVLHFPDLYERPVEVARSLSRHLGMRRPRRKVLRNVEAAVVGELRHHSGPEAPPGPRMEAAIGFFRRLTSRDQVDVTSECWELRRTWTR